MHLCTRRDLSWETVSAMQAAISACGRPSEHGKREAMAAKLIRIVQASPTEAEVRRRVKGL